MTLYRRFGLFLTGLLFRFSTSPRNRSFRANTQTPAQREAERIEHERFSRERPTQEELLVSGEYVGPYPHGSLFQEGYDR